MLKAQSVAAAYSILSDLDKKSSGSTSYRASTVHDIGNKAAIVNPKSTVAHPLPPNPGYEYVPEMLASYDSRTQTILVRSIAGLLPGHSQEDTSVQVGFNIGADSSIARTAAKRNLTTDDFRDALTDPSLALSFVSTSYDEQIGGHNGPNTYVNKGIMIYNGDFYVADYMDGDEAYIQSHDKHRYIPEPSLNPRIADTQQIVSRANLIATILPNATAQLAIFSNNQLPSTF